MSMSGTPSGDRVHIGIFGRRNAGKSSVINAMTGQSLSIVSPVKGTTTDPVQKTMELLPLGPVVLIDTPGVDDQGELGALRVKRSYQVLNKVDVAVLVVDGEEGFTPEDQAMENRLLEKRIPYVIAVNKLDQLREKDKALELLPAPRGEVLFVSCTTGENIYELKEKLAALVPENLSEYPILRDLIAPSDNVILVTPIDKAAPKGRLILPQQQTLREALEAGAVSLVVQPEELSQALETLRTPPRLVITDSQAFANVSRQTPKEIPLTSFSILFARHKGNLQELVKGVRALENLQDGDSVLISEGCTHHRQCGDIGTEKLPAWIRSYTQKELRFVWTSGTEFPEDLSPYQMVIHCGGCMLNEREMKYRIRCAADQGVPISNYGMVIAQVTGILRRSLEIFPQTLALLE